MNCKFMDFSRRFKNFHRCLYFIICDVREILMLFVFQKINANKFALQSLKI